MSKNYKFHKPEGLYFVSFAVVDWLDVFMYQPEGYVQPTVTSSGVEMNYVYQYKDHLGNIRLSYSDNDGNGTISQSEIIEEHNYYPFGLKQKGYNNNVNGTHHKYMFGGKEYDESFQTLNTYDFGARNYDPALGRWMNIDLLAEQMRRHSPYNYAFNNPIYFIDPDGMAPDGFWDDLKKAVNKIKGGVLKHVREDSNINREKDLNSGDNARVAKATEERKAVQDEASTDIMTGTVEATVASLEIIDEGAQVVADGANAVTVATGGASLPVTGPLAATATGVSMSAKASKAMIHFEGGDNEKGVKEIKSLAVTTVSSVAGSGAAKKVAKIQGLTKVQRKVTESSFSLTLGYWRRAFLGF